MIEFDVETTGLQWYAHEVFLVQFYDPTDPDCEVPPTVCDACGAPVDPEGDPDVCGACEAPLEAGSEAAVYFHPQDREHIARWLAKDADFRAWNSKFDLHFLDAAGYTLPPEDRWHDGMLVAHILDGRPSRPVALQKTGDRLFGKEDERDENGVLVRQGAEGRTEVAVKDWLREETKRRRKQSKATGEEFIRPNYSDVPNDIMIPYASHDVTLQRRICDVQDPSLNSQGDLLQVYTRLERPCLPALFGVEKRGMPIDRPGAEAFERELEAELDGRLARCRELAGDEEFNPGSGAQIGEALKRRGADLTYTRKLENGKPATDKDALASIDDELAREVEAFRNVTKLYSTNIHPILHPDMETDFGYRAPYLAPDGRLHTNLRQVGARTGRMSSSDPNVQNWPRDDLRMRHLVQATPGHKLIAVDLDSIELRVFAAFIGEGTLLEMMRNPDADLHQHTADMIGLYDYDRGGGVIESARQRGKKFNYSMIYGAGVRSIRAAFHVSQAEAKDMIWAYRDAYPEVVEFQNQIEYTLEEQGYVRTPWGRHHRVDDPRHVEREAYKFGNYLVQGTSADLFKEAVVRCHEQKIPMIALTHDEILSESPEDKVEEHAAIIQKALCDHPKITKIIPLDAEAKIVDRWSLAKDKDFDPEWMV